VTFQEKKYVSALEQSHEEWKRKAAAAMGLLEDILCAQAFTLGQRMAVHEERSKVGGTVMNWHDGARAALWVYADEIGCNDDP